MEEGSDQREAGSRGLYLNLCDGLDSAWDTQELNKHYLMIANHGFAEELNFETWKNNLSPLSLSLLISKMGPSQQALQTQMPAWAREAVSMNEGVSGREK